MKRNWSLTSRLSLVFAGAMMSVWLLTSMLLVAALGSYFRSQDLTLLAGKLELATELLESEFRAGKPDSAGISRKLADAMVGHSGLYLSISTADSQILAAYASPGFPVPPDRFAGATRKLNVLQTLEENGWRYNVMIKKIDAGRTGWHQDVLATAAIDTGFHDEFILELKEWLMWFNGGLIFLSFLLGWFATRIGLRPLNEINRLASAITVNNLGERLPERHIPAELIPTVAEFNAMLERLDGSFRRLSDFSSDIAHELRTPLSNLMMQTQVALSRERDAASYREVLFSNLEELSRLARMSSDMLFLAKSENGLLAMESETLSAKTEIEELIEFFEPLAAENDKKMILEGDASLKADRLMLRRALINLITNALKYSSDSTAIMIRAEQQDGMGCIHISNRTEGITQKSLSRLFDRFYRVDSSRPKNTDGAGLGLSIARAIVQAHNGTLQVFMDGDTVTFTVKLPAT
ncbi:TPA: heavy metal sensor histidine kinase [Enterobacter cloacae]|nr:heavy metal sensor histidine kinase [Enterobacter cloacae]HCR1076968.1 heavy metal sensor histidine kinase [Enterobacter cloacae]